MTTPDTAIASAPKVPSRTAKRARNVLRRKGKGKTPFEDALASDDTGKAERLVQWARNEFTKYHGDLGTWRENRRRYANEAADVFTHRERDRESAREKAANGAPAVFTLANDSLNVVASLAEFASAQTEQDIVGGEPWFAALPVGRLDKKLGEDIQKHLQWLHRDGRLVSQYGRAITTAACLGEVFTKTYYDIETDLHEAEVNVLHIDGKPVMDADEYIEAGPAGEARAAEMKLKGKPEWLPIYMVREPVIRQGTDVELLRHEDVAFRADASDLDLRFTNFYNQVEMTVLDAKKRFKLSKQDALRLAREASRDQTPDPVEFESDIDAPPDVGNGQEEAFGDAEEERLLNLRVRLIEGWVKVDPFGDGTARRLYLVFPPVNSDWLVYGNYLANLSPKAELPVKCHTWEPVPGKLYGRGFFAKYAHVQTQVDDTWNQVGFRNRMHANPITAYHPENLEKDENDGDLAIYPGMNVKPKANKTLKDVLEFAEMPDLDDRSMELMQIGIQMVQLRSGVSSASQGDMSGMPENNTATGIRQLMSRAAVLLKKPSRNLRRSFGGAFSYNVKLTYANFDRQEAFVWGEGANQEMIEMTPEMVADLDIDVRMLLTQEQNASKLEGATAAIGAFMQWVTLPELEKQSARPLFLQAIKALEFDQADEIIREAIVTLEDAVAVLPPEEQQRAMMMMQMAAQAQAAIAVPASVSPQGGPLSPEPAAPEAPKLMPSPAKAA